MGVRAGCEEPGMGGLVGQGHRFGLAHIRRWSHILCHREGGRKEASSQSEDRQRGLRASHSCAKARWHQNEP